MNNNYYEMNDCCSYILHKGLEKKPCTWRTGGGGGVANGYLLELLHNVYLKNW